MRQNRSDAGSVESGKPKFSYGEGLSMAPADFIELYRAARTRESRQKARLFELKNGRLTSIYVDRGRCIHEISTTSGVVKRRPWIGVALLEGKESIAGPLSQLRRVQVTPAIVASVRSAGAKNKTR